MSNPQKYESVQDYLIAEGFTISGECFVKGAITIPAEEMIGHTPNTFAHKAREHGWVAWIENGYEYPFRHLKKQIEDAVRDDVKPLFWEEKKGVPRLIISGKELSSDFDYSTVNLGEYADIAPDLSGMVIEVDTGEKSGGETIC